MADLVYAEDDDGYFGYVETSHDPGYSLIFATILFCIISYCSLPFMVALGNRLDVKNSTKQIMMDDVSKRSRSRKSRRRRRKLQQQQQSPPSTNDDNKINNHQQNAIMEEEEEEADDEEDAIFYETDIADDDRSFVSARSHLSCHSHRTKKRRNRAKRQMEKRHGQEEFELRMQRLVDTDNDDDDLAEDPDFQRRGDASSERYSVMGPMDHDEVSMDDAASAVGRTPLQLQQHQQQALAMASKTKANINNNPTMMTKKRDKTDGDTTGTTASSSSSFWDTLLDLVLCDFESKRIIKLAIPFATQAFSTGVLEMVTVAVIGRVLGTKEVSAFVIVRTLIDITSSFFGGFHESIATLCSQALGRRNHKLVGQYVQLSMILYVLCYIPFIALWWMYMPSIMLWLGFDQETADIGQEYTRVYLFLELLDGVDESIHGLLDVIDLESYSTLVGVSQEVVTFLDILLVTIFAKPSLRVVGMIELFVALIFIGINCGTIAWRGWFAPYREGLVGSWALSNRPAFRIMMSTAASLSFGYLLTDGEWEILTLFASVLGPAEVAAWGILGVLWDAVEQLTEAIADAAEVRCAFLLGSGQHEKAKRSAQKSLLFGVFLSLFLTSAVLIVGDNVATFFTNDPALQHIIADLIPLFAVGNMTLTVGTMCWTLLGSQGRYRLATFVACMASWLVTLPLAALFTFHLRINLQGQTAAIVIGYMVSGTTNAYFLFRSNWEKISEDVMEATEHEELLVAAKKGTSDASAQSGTHQATDSRGGAALPDHLNPAHGGLGTLVEASFGENSSTASSSGAGARDTPDTTPEKELV